ISRSNRPIGYYLHPPTTNEVGEKFPRRQNPRTRRVSPIPPALRFPFPILARAQPFSRRPAAPVIPTVPTTVLGIAPEARMPLIARPLAARRTAAGTFRPARSSSTMSEHPCYYLGARC